MPALLGLVLPLLANADPIRIVIEVEPDVERGRRLYEICASCHLPEGWGHRDGTYPALAGQHPNVLMKQLVDIREGKRENPIMYPFVQDRTIGGLRSLADIVAYIAALPANPDPGLGPWEAGTEEYRRGEVIYRAQCAACHGEQGEGEDARAFPRLQGQHYRYLLRQVRDVLSGRRKNAHPAMRVIAETLGDQDLQQVINYVSRLPAPPDSGAVGPRLGP